MKYILLLAFISSASYAELPRVEGCIKDKVYKAIDQNGNVIVVSCQVYRVISTKAGKG